MKRPAQPRGFTVVELTIVLALVTVIMALIIVRFDWGSPRQHVIAEARKLGNAIATYRERAMNEQQLYLLQLDQDQNAWAIRPPSPAAGITVASLVSGSFERPIKLNSIKTTTEGLALQSPVLLAFNPQGTTTPLSIDLSVENGPGITLRIDPLVNEVVYAEH